jgi:uncharacterized membrane protein
MRTPASIANHPLHPMLIVFPVGLWIFSLLCDLVALGSSAADTWRTVALYTMAGGFVGALLAALPGLVDLLSLRSPTTRRIGVIHMSINLIVVALYAVNLWLRTGGGDGGSLPLWLSIVSVGLLAISGWLGAELVHVHGVGVRGGDEHDERAATDAAANRTARLRPH